MPSYIYIGLESQFKTGIPDKPLGMISEELGSGLNDTVYFNFMDRGEHIQDNYIGSGSISLNIRINDSFLNLFKVAMGKQIDFADKTLYQNGNISYGALIAAVSSDTTSFDVYPLTANCFDSAANLVVGSEIMAVTNIASAADSQSPSGVRYTFDVTRAQNSTMAKDYSTNDAVFGMIDSTSSDVSVFVSDYYDRISHKIDESLCVEAKRDSDYFLYNGVKVDSFAFEFRVDVLPVFGFDCMFAKEIVDTTSVVSDSVREQLYDGDFITTLGISTYAGLNQIQLTEFSLNANNNLFASYVPGTEEISSLVCAHRMVTGEMSFLDNDIDNYNHYKSGDVFSIMLLGVIESGSIVLCGRRIVYEPFTPQMSDGYIIANDVNYDSLEDLLILIEQNK